MHILYLCGESSSDIIDKMVHIMVASHTCNQQIQNSLAVLYLATVEMATSPLPTLIPSISVNIPICQIFVSDYFFPAVCVRVVNVCLFIIRGGLYHISRKLYIFFVTSHNFFSLSSVQIIIIPACCLLCVL